MGRKKKNAVYRHYELHEGRDSTATCLVGECKKVLKTQHSGNLLKHLKHQHKDEYKEVMAVNNSQNTTNTTTRDVSDTVLKECTNLVAIHGRPFSMMNDKAFKNLVKLIPGNTSTINATNVRESVQSMAAKMRDELANDLNGKLISLKVDIASLATRSFMGINCQYLQDGKITLRNLGTIEIFQRHTSEHLKDLLLYNLQRFRIDTECHKNIYCVTTDNGANMIKMSKLLNDDRVSASLHSLDINIFDDMQAGTSSDQTNDENLDLYNVESDDMNDNDEIEQVLTERVTEVLRAQFINRTDIENGGCEIGIVRCAAHTLQLALMDACKNRATSNLIASCRQVVRRLRTPQFVRTIKECDKNVPKLDCTTRWHSAVDMVESLLSLKNICATDQRLHLPDSTWNSLKEFLECFTPAKELTKKLQEEQLTVGDFYLSWMLCRFTLAKINSRMSTDIIAAMTEREKLLFENDIFINGIYLDPRVNSVLTQDQQKKAKDNLIKLYMQNFELRQSAERHTANNSDESVVTIPNTNDKRTEAQVELEDFLNTSYIGKHDDLMLLLTRNPRLDTVNSLQQSLNLFLEEPLLKSDENVLSFWKNSCDKFPFLHKLSSIVLAAPMTQVSVERLFSSLKFVVSHHRLSMTDDIIEDLLFIRSNTMFDKDNCHRD